MYITGKCVTFLVQFCDSILITTSLDLVAQINDSMER